MNPESAPLKPQSRILIKNIYYMLSYAFKALEKKDFERIEAEPFEHIQDLYAEILSRGVSSQIKRGLYREYVPKCESMASFRGRLDLVGTIHNRTQHRQEVSCEFDELTENNTFNRIVRTTIGILLKSREVEKVRKESLKKLLSFLSHIDEIDLRSVHWNTLCFQRNNQTYEMIINICYLVYEGLVLSEDNGDSKVYSFFEKQVERLYERFVLEFYRKEFHGRLIASAPFIDWAINEAEENQGLIYLPRMRSDIVLRKGDRALIIDTKYYGHLLQTRFDVGKIHNQNLYQILAYVMNEDRESRGNVAGMLLYAKTQEAVSPDMDFYVKSNRFMVKTLDLNVEFKSIKEQLESIAYDQFPDLRPS